MKVESIIDFIMWKREQIKSGIMFRGQVESSWELLPSIVRYANNGTIREQYSSITETEDHLVDLFKAYATPYKDYLEMGTAKVLVHAQHFGLPTRLLDWTTNYLKALYFAVDDPRYDSVDGIVYGFFPKNWNSRTRYTPSDQVLTSFIPEPLNERLAAQEGCFVFFPLPNDSFSVLPMNKTNYPEDIEDFANAIISAKHKKKIRMELNELGINHRTIYPGLDGVTKSIKSELSLYTI